MFLIVTFTEGHELWNQIVSYCQVIITFCLMQSMEKGFHPKFLEYASEKTRWVFWWVFSSGYEVKKPGGFFRVGWVFSNVGIVSQSGIICHVTCSISMILDLRLLDA